MKITQAQLNEILEKNKKCLNGEEDGERADLSGANLRVAEFVGLPIYTVIDALYNTLEKKGDQR